MWGCPYIGYMNNYKRGFLSEREADIFRVNYRVYSALFNISHYKVAQLVGLDKQTLRERVNGEDIERRLAGEVASVFNVTLEHMTTELPFYLSPRQARFLKSRRSRRCLNELVVYLMGLISIDQFEKNIRSIRQRKTT